MYAQGSPNDRRVARGMPEEVQYDNLGNNEIMQTTLIIWGFAL